ncbi:MAG: hypothetical protein KIS92_19575 [Planctomycetota bacterium]|nr:hypothetical protein [Planctomycetota bacterium]
MTKVRMLFGLAMALCVLRFAAAVEDPPPPGPGGDVVDLQPQQPDIPDRIRLNSVFKVTEGERLWNDAYRVASQPMSSLGEPIRITSMLPQQFEYTKGLRLESYEAGQAIRHSNFVLQAAEARTAGSRIKLNHVVMAFSMAGGGGVPFFGMQKSAAPAKEAAPARPPGRIVIRAKAGFFDTEQSMGEASGGVIVEIYSGEEADPAEPMGRLESSRLRMRMWENPVLGTTEMGMYVIDDDPEEPGPAIKGRFLETRPDGSTSTMHVQANGMIFENSLLDHMAPQIVDGKTVGISNVRLRRAIFHKAIRMITEGGTSASLMPFQQSGAPGAAAKAAPPPAEPTRTIVECAGPCVMDFAAIPRKVDVANANLPMQFSQRFIFLNRVHMKTEPLEAGAPKPPPPPPAAGQPAPAASLQEGELNCRHLCLQYPPAPPPGAAPAASGESASAMKMPEYAEALGGVRIRGTKAPPPGTQANAPKKPFTIDCQRLYYDALTDMINLEGLPGTPMELVDEIGELKAQICSIVRRTGVISMPLHGLKVMKVRPDALASLSPANPATPAPAPPKPPAGEAGFLEVSCLGPFTREVREIITAPNEPPIVKNILKMEKSVSISDPTMGLKVQAEDVKTVLDGKTLQPERLEAYRDVKATLEGKDCEGGALTIDLGYKPDGTPSKREVHVWGDAEKKTNAYLWMGETTAITSKTFVLDGITNSLWATNGAVACVAMPAEAGAPAAAPAGGMPAMNLKPAGRMTLQCDGDLHFDGSTGILKMMKNVYVSQEGMRIATDSLFLSLDQTPEPKKEEAKPDPKKPAPPADPKKPAEKPPAAQTAMGGSPKTFECLGHVELVTDSQVIHCDHLFYDIPNDRAFLKTTAPNDYVRIYLSQSAGTTNLLEVRHRLDYDGKQNTYTPETSVFISPFKGRQPLPRGVPSELEKGGVAP